MFGCTPPRVCSSTVSTASTIGAADPYRKRELREKFRECVGREPAMTRDADAEFDRVRAIDSAAVCQLWAT